MRAHGQVQILRALSFEAGEVLCLMGAMARASPAMKAIMGLVPVTGGAITLDGTVISGLPAESAAPPGRLCTAGAAAFRRDLTVAENIEIGLLTRRRGQRVDHGKYDSSAVA